MNNIAARTSTIHSTKTSRLTYMGRRCTLTTTKHERKSTGLRTVEYVWIDDATESNGGHVAGTRVIRVMEGDGRPGHDSGFVIHSEEIISPA